MCTSFKQELLVGSHNFTNSSGDTFKLALYDNSATFTAATTAYTSSNEGGVIDMRAVGGDIEDPNGSGDVDTVNAILADGEFVMTKQAVTGLGEGDHEAGIARLYAMMDKNENKAQGMGIGRA